MPDLTITATVTDLQLTAMARVAAAQRTTVDALAIRAVVECARAIAEAYVHELKTRVDVVLDKATDEEKAQLAALVETITAR